MTVKTIDKFIHERKLARPLPLTALKDTTLGIDAEYFFQQQFGPPGKKEPLLNALGGLPFAVEATLENFVNALQSAGVKPLFVFKGVQIYQNERAFTRSDYRQQKRTDAWDAYDKAKGDTAVAIFNEIDAIALSEIARFAMKVLHKKHVDFMVAPYCPWAQLAYLHKHENRYIDAVYGPTEVLFYDVDRLITSMDYSGGGFSWVNKSSLLAELGGLPSEQFLDLCILIGLEFSAPFPILEQSQMGGSMAIRIARDLIRNYVSGYGAVMAYAEHPIVRETGYIETYRRVYCAVKYHVIMTDKAHLEPINVENAPNDIHEFVSQRLPPELYFYLSRGIVGPEILNALTSGTLVEHVPLDGGESIEYRRFLSELESLKSQQLSLLTQPLHRFYQAKRINVLYWYDRAVEHDIPHRLTPTTYDTVNSWYVPNAILKPKLAESKKNQVDLNFAILSLQDADFAKSTNKPKDPEKPFITRDEISASTYWRFLQLRNFVTSQHKLTPWGEALASSLSASQAQDQFAEPLIVAIELIRAGALTSKTYAPSYSGLPIRGTDVEKGHILLIARVASLLPIGHMPIGFSGPLSRNLLSFNSFVHKYIESARTLMETIVFSLLANGDADRLVLQNVDWLELGVTLPFTCSPNCGLGIAMKTYLDELCGKSDPTDESERLKMKDELKKLLAHALDVVSDIEKAFRLWDAVVLVVKTAATNRAIDLKAAQEFFDADEWVQQRR